MTQRGMWLDRMNWDAHPVCQIDWQHLCVLERVKGRGGEGGLFWMTHNSILHEVHISDHLGTFDMVHTHFRDHLTCFRYTLASERYDILIFQLVGYAVHIAMSQFHILEPWWVCNDTSKHVSYDTCLILHPVTSWLMNSGSFCGAMVQWETRGRGLEERKRALVGWSGGT